MLKMNASPLVLLLIFCFGFNAVLPYSSAQKPSSIASQAIQEISEYESALSMLRSKRASNNSLTETVLQLESLVSFANALILTEAVRNHTINVSSIVIDFLILEHLPKEHEWMDVLKAESVDPNDIKEINKLFGELKPLQELIENAETRSIDVEVISNVLSILKGVEPAGQFLEHAKSLKKFFAENQASSLAQDASLENNLKIVFDLSSSLYGLHNSSLNIETLRKIPVALNWAETAAAKKVAVSMKKALDACSMYTKNESGDRELLKQTCVRGLIENVKKIPLNDLAPEEMVFCADWLKVFEISSKIALGIVKSKSEMFKELLTKFKSLREIKYPETEQNITNLLSIINVLNSSISDSESINYLLNSLKPITSIVDIIRSYHNMSGIATPSTEQFSARRLQSYAGFSNGIQSLQKLANGIASFFVRGEVWSSEINSRSDLIKKWGSQITPIPEKANGLNLVEYFLSASDEIKRVSNLLSPDVLNKFEGYSNLTHQFPEFDPSFLTAVVGIIETSTNNEWQQLLDKVKNAAKKALIESTESSAVLNKLLPLPDAIFFYSEVLTSFGERLWSATSLSHNEVDELIEPVTTMLKKNPRGFEAMQEMENSTSIDGQISEKKIADFIEYLGNFSVPSFERVNFLPDDVPQGMKTIQDYVSRMNALAKNENLVDRIVKAFTSISELSNTSSITLEEKDVEATKELLKLLARPPKIDTVSDKSEIMAPLLSGSPFGNEILRNLSHGLLVFHELVGGIESTDVLVASAREMKLEKLLKGVEIVQVVNSSFSPNSLEVLSSVSIITSRLDQLQKWIEKIDDPSRIAAVQKLESIKSSDAAILLRHFLINVNKSTVAGIKSLSAGLRKFYLVLLGLDCEKKPEHPLCGGKRIINASESLPPEKQSITVIIALSIVAGTFLFIVAVGLSFFFGSIWAKRNNSTKDPKKLEKMSDDEKKRAISCISRSLFKLSVDIFQKVVQMEDELDEKMRKAPNFSVNPYQVVRAYGLLSKFALGKTLKDLESYIESMLEFEGAAENIDETLSFLNEKCKQRCCLRFFHEFSHDYLKPVDISAINRLYSDQESRDSFVKMSFSTDPDGLYSSFRIDQELAISTENRIRWAVPEKYLPNWRASSCLVSSFDATFYLSEKKYKIADITVQFFDNLGEMAIITGLQLKGVFSVFCVGERNILRIESSEEGLYLYIVQNVNLSVNNYDVLFSDRQWKDEKLTIEIPNTVISSPISLFDHAKTSGLWRLFDGEKAELGKYHSDESRNPHIAPLWDHYHKNLFGIKTNPQEKVDVSPYREDPHGSDVCERRLDKKVSTKRRRAGESSICSDENVWTFNEPFTFILTRVVEGIQLTQSVGVFNNTPVIGGPAGFTDASSKKND